MKKFYSNKMSTTKLRGKKFLNAKKRGVKTDYNQTAELKKFLEAEKSSVENRELQIEYEIYFFLF